MDGMSALYQDFLNLCETAPPLPAPWDFLAGREDRGGIPDSRLTLTALLNAYPPQQLLFSGLVKRGVQGEYNLARPLRHPCRLLPIQGGGKVRGLLTARGVLPRARMHLAALPDVEPVQHGGAVLGCVDVDDATILHTLGFRVTMVRQLHAQSPARLRVLDRFYQAEHDKRPALLLVGCGLARCQPRPRQRLATVLRHLVEARRELSIDLGGVMLWTPPPSFCTDLQRRLRGRTRRGLRSLVEDCLDHVQDLEEALAPVPKQAHDLVDTAAQLRAAAREGYDAAEVRELERHYEALVEERFIAPLIDSALERPDKHEANLEMLLADCYRELLRRGPKLHGLLGADPAAARSYATSIKRVVSLINAWSRYGRMP